MQTDDPKFSARECGRLKQRYGLIPQIIIEEFASDFHAPGSSTSENATPSHPWLLSRRLALVEIRDALGVASDCFKFLLAVKLTDG